ncbi:hypothetical protein QYF61_027465 [Mycteria americana]|uniref:Uncharacterized protein n=1 Tax=Mycteria americana TaxID=33587 RepID=A0AAN7NG76_MYCAM|nr:hypothetical protein QYF61_027465 [Mycteria americana]
MATKVIRGLEHMTYKDRLASFSMGKRRQRKHLIVLSTPYGELQGRWRQTILGDFYAFRKFTKEQTEKTGCGRKPIFKLLVLVAFAKKEGNSGNRRLFSLILLSGKIMEHTPLESIFKDRKDQKVIRNIELGFTNLTAFYDKVTVSVDKTDFSMAFDTISHGTLLWKWREGGLDKCYMG